MYLILDIIRDNSDNEEHQNNYTIWKIAEVILKNTQKKKLKGHYYVYD